MRAEGRVEADQVVRSGREAGQPFEAIPRVQRVRCEPHAYPLPGLARPSPAPHGNFDQPIEVVRGPYEYSVPGSDQDYAPQAEPAST